MAPYCHLVIKLGTLNICRTFLGFGLQVSTMEKLPLVPRTNGVLGASGVVGSRGVNVPPTVLISVLENWIMLEKGNNAVKSVGLVPIPP